MSWLKNKKVVAIIVTVLMLLVIGGVVAVTRKQAPSLDDGLVAKNLPKLDPSEIGMIVTVRKDNKAIMFELTKAADITHVEYTIEYDKEVDGQKVPEGIFGIMNIAEDGITKTDFREFGTCSSGKCRYDKVVSDVKITLTVTKKDHKDYLVEKVVKL